MVKQPIGWDLLGPLGQELPRDVRVGVEHRQTDIADPRGAGQLLADRDAERPRAHTGRRLLMRAAV
jgi:hypothetical protein